MIFGEYSYEDDIRVQRQEAYEEGVAKQKAEDEKLLQAAVAKISAQKDVENMKLSQRIKELESLLAENARLKAKQSKR